MAKHCTDTSGLEDIMLYIFLENDRSGDMKILPPIHERQSKNVINGKIQGIDYESIYLQ